MDKEQKFFYSNGVTLAVTPYDLVIQFQRNGPLEDFGTPSAAGSSLVPAPVQHQVDDKINVLMSPQHAKAMLPGLFAAIAQYEQSIGPLKLQPEIQQAWDKTFGALNRLG